MSFGVATLTVGRCEEKKDSMGINEFGKVIVVIGPADKRNVEPRSFSAVRTPEKVENSNLK